MKADVIKFADDSVTVSSLDSDTDHGPVVNYFIDWCERFLLNITVKKTKQMIIDFRKKRSPISSVFIHGQTGHHHWQWTYIWGQRRCYLHEGPPVYALLS